MKLAAIDIGSNAARLLIVEAQKNNHTENVIFNKVNLVRIPLRLGFDVFSKGKIGEEKEAMLLNTMQAFKYLMNAYDVQAVKACATSAMRDAENAAQIVNDVKTKTAIDIEVISGDKEASVIFENHIAEKLTKENAYVYIDVGGGSTEVNLFVQGVQVYKKSFNVGTIRLLNKQWSDEDWRKMKAEIKQNIKSRLPITIIGSGGNINKVFSLSKTKDGKPLSYRQLKKYHKDIATLSVEERIQQLKLKPDRADVIVPALEIYINLMRWMDAAEIYVPKIGVADGLVRSLYAEINSHKN